MNWDKLNTRLLAAILVVLILDRAMPPNTKRFVIFDKDNADIAFDTETGRLCRTEPPEPNKTVTPGIEPYCMNIK
jgi:hypothetical protein